MGKPKHIGHGPGCATCREQGVCNACGRSLVKNEQCTNGRCRECHSRICTPGGATGPGHGFGKEKDHG